MSSRILLAFGAALAGLAVVAGAFGAHGLKSRLDADQMANFETAVRYHMYHALGLIALGLFDSRATGLRTAAGCCFLIGIAVFCGCLYGYTLSGERWLARIVPFGGLALIAGWLCFTLAALRRS